MALIRRVAVYCRLSVATEESVSIARQSLSARKYAEARGWTVALTAVDEGVSATKNRPEDRPGWRSILDAEEQFDAVVVWKVDRLARRVIDFLRADEMLQARGASIVAVEDPVDMTTAQGRAFAQVLAVFGEMEAAAISARVKAARRTLVHAGRRVGGRPPFGFVNAPNPEGPGYVLAHDPERIDAVRQLVDRALRGASLYALARWLEDEGVPPRMRAGRTSKHWHEASVEAILRSPALAGMTPYTPGRRPGDKATRVDVVRDADGLPVLDESVALITPEERRRLLAVLDERKLPGSRPSRADAALLTGLIVCGSCERPLHRAAGAGRPYYRCQNRDCSLQTSAARPAVEQLVVDDFLSTAGHLPVVMLAFDDSAPASSSSLTELEAAIADTLQRMGDDDADVTALAERLSDLKAARSRARASADAAPSLLRHDTGLTFAQAWDLNADDLGARRDLLASAVERVVLRPAPTRGGRGVDPSRLSILYRGGEADLT